MQNLSDGAHGDMRTLHPRMMLRYSAPLYSPWLAGDQAQLRPCSPLRTEKAATPPENNGACPRGHRGHRAQQITRTPPCNAIMSSERPGQLIDLLLSMAQSWHMEPVEAGRGKLQLGAGAHCAILCVCIQRTGKRRANVCKSALLL